MSAFPTDDELRFSNAQYAVALRRLLRRPLGLNVGEAEHCLCKRGGLAVTALTDYHAEVCGFCGKIARHDKCNAVLVRAMRAAGAQN